jgi:hypothetical protein
MKMHGKTPCMFASIQFTVARIVPRCLVFLAGSSDNDLERATRDIQQLK